VLLGITIGHVRYSTAGSASSLANVQPFLAGYRFGKLAVAHNGNLVNYSSLRASLEDSGSILNISSDTEVILHLIANSNSRPLISRIVDACQAFQGAYSLVFLTKNKLFAARDPYGFRPLVLGRLRRPSRGIVFASETCALDLIEADYEREVNPGEVIFVDGHDLSISSLCLMPPKPRKACIFEHIYFALPNSIFTHCSLRHIRMSLITIVACYYHLFPLLSIAAATASCHCPYIRTSLHVVTHCSLRHNRMSLITVVACHYHLFPLLTIAVATASCRCPQPLLTSTARNHLASSPVATTDTTVGFHQLYFTLQSYYFKPNKK
ncbi:amidophosphoribosyltransferase 1, chloroplastic-like, partial [Dendrobium catenatum]|uniref:amidophosphoribosyltransferase 1, chloroplastic-like n=1 Tax=Dendrobium catenatum TaxID=906689 RepID=UPI0010A02026